MTKNGKVYLAGAGPGDINLITVKLDKILSQVDVVLYDNLANNELLNKCKDDCEKIYVGKSAGNHTIPQEEISQLLITFAKKGKNVLRLKGGDPLIFGRGSEEALELTKYGIDFEFIPGITAGLAAATYSGIPITHRNLVTQTVLITGHEAPDKTYNQVDWAHLAKMKNTNLIIYMGVSSITKISQKLIDFGKPKSTKIAIIQNATLTNQRSFITTLKELPEFIIENNIKPPTIFIIGPTIHFKNELNWFENLPLFSKKIVTTRATDQAQSLFNLLKDNGAEVLSCSVIKTELTKVDFKLYDFFNSYKYEWIIFTSENGVRYFFKNLELQGLDSRILADSKLAAIGSSTEKKLKEFGIIADFVPSKFTSHSLMEEFPLKYEIKNKSILRIKGNFQNDLVFDKLQDLKANVIPLEVYKTSKDQPDEKTLELIKNNKIDAFLFTSTSTVMNFLNLFGENTAKNILNHSNVFSIGPTTAEFLKEMKIENVIVSEIHTIEGLVQTLINYFHK